MTPDSFDAVAAVLSDALLLLSPEGVIRGVNPRGLAAIGSSRKEDVIGRDLTHWFDDPQRTVRKLLRAARRTTDDTFGTIPINDGSPHRVIVRRVNGAADELYLLLRIEPPELALQQFAILNEKVNQLNREISKRKRVEDQLRIGRDVAEFGRDVGIELVRPQALDAALASCTNLMVERLGATFARIWLANEARTELHLVASSGLYTHLDGAHARIRFGEYKIGRIAQNQTPHVTNSVVGDQQIHDQQWARQEGMVAFAGYPLVDDDVTVGVVGLFSREPLSEAVSSSLASVANSISLRIRKQSSEDGLAKQTLALKEADRRKDEFLAMLSHELRNPLAPVRSGLDLLALEETGNQESIEMMQIQVDHLVRLVDDLLDVSRIMRGKVELRREPVKLEPLILHARETLHDEIERADHKFSLSIPKQPVWIDADGVRIIQVIENLLKNACKYTDCGGHIDVSVECTEGDVNVRVKDNGIGIERDLLPELFDLFTQSQRTSDRSQGGLGIGLTLVRNLVEMHGGTVTGSSEGLGRGSEFTVSLPTCDPPDKKADDKDRKHDTVEKPLKILAVDDNRAARMMLARLFEKLGPHLVSTAEDGPDAIEKFGQLVPDLVLLDIGLPGMDGYQLARELRAARPDDSYLLVALTGYGQREDRRKSKEAGFDEHLVKPPSIEQLRELLSHQKIHQKFATG